MYINNIKYIKMTSRLVIQITKKGDCLLHKKTHQFGKHISKIF